MEDWTPKDLIALAALAFSIYTFIRQKRNEKLAPLKSDVLQAIRDLKAVAAGVSDAVIDHITFAKTRAPKEVIYRMQQNADAEREALENRLQCRKEEVLRHYTDWWKIVSSYFPIQERASKVGHNSAEVVAVRNAQKELVSFLDGLLLDCHRGKLKIR